MDSGAGTVRERFGFACWTGPATQMARAHVHDEVEVNLALDAPLQYLIGGRVQDVPRRRLCLFWANAPHQLLPVSSRMAWLTVPLHTFLSWHPDENLVARLLSGELVLAPPTVPRAAESLARWARDLAATPAREDVVHLEAQAMMRRLGAAYPASGRTAERAAGRTAERANWGGDGVRAVAAMAGYVARHSTEPVRVAHVAAAAHLSPAYAMGLFHRQVGMTIGRYLEHCRLAEAQRLLVGTGLPVLEVAARSGFGSSARFHAVFRQRTGTTPARYRRRAEGVNAARPAA